MGRYTGISRFSSSIRASSTAAALLATILSCTDGSTAPSALSRRDPSLAGSAIIRYHVADSLKHMGPQASARLLGALRVSLDVVADPDPIPSIYTVSTVPFSPEPSPVNQVLPDPSSPEPDCDDCVRTHVPIGFNFTFYGNSFSEVDISSNGLIQVGSTRPLLDGCCWGGEMPSNDLYNNIIAVAWTDLAPSAPGDIAFETQGTAPNRKFVVQWNNVPEVRGPFQQVQGHVTAQLVLSEGSNDITIYTTNMDFTGDTHFVTQGIENADGTEAAFAMQPDGSAPRVQARFNLSNDAVRFRIRPIGKPITIVAPPNLDLGTNARACFATVSLGQPKVSGGGAGLTVSGHRNDGLELSDNYPLGVTTITWTATDEAGTTELATQTVTISDREGPQIFLPSNAVVRNDPGLATAVVNVGVGRVEDNCPNYSLGDAPNGVYPVGTTPAVWTARDAAGNVSTATQLVTVKDVEAPTITLPATITVNATSPSGARVSFEGSGHDNVAVTSFSCSPVSGTKFPIGWTSASCSAVDAAGNKSAPASLWVNVLGAPQQIAALIASIRAILPAKYEENRDNDGHGDNDGHHWGRRGNQLMYALSSALMNSRNPRSACTAMDLIASIVRANTPSVFPTANSTQIRADIARIKNVMGCRW